MPRKAKGKDVSRIGDWYPERHSRKSMDDLRKERAQAAKRADDRRKGAAVDAAVSRSEAARVPRDAAADALAARERALLEAQAFGLPPVFDPMGGAPARPERRSDVPPDVEQDAVRPARRR